jgi:hypothetical protein
MPADLNCKDHPATFQISNPCARCRRLPLWLFETGPSGRDRSVLAEENLSTFVEQ